MSPETCEHEFLSGENIIGIESFGPINKELPEDCGELIPGSIFTHILSLLGSFE
jgi:hypothetical protein